MAFYEWNPELLSVHVSEMDSEHQVLIQKMNKVYDLAKSDAAKPTLDAAVEDFAKFTVKHFRDEEAYMERIQYAGTATHKIIHQQLLAEVSKHLESYKTTGKLADAFFNFLGVWLTSHIRGIDRKYGPGYKG
jgi:hemerythrin